MTTFWVLLEGDYLPEDGVFSTKQLAVDALVKRLPDRAIGIRESAANMAVKSVLFVKAGTTYTLWERELQGSDSRHDTQPLEAMSL